MKTYVLKRIGSAIITLILITFLLFWLVRVMPGNPFPSERMSREAIAEKRLEMAETDRDIQGYTDGVFWERNTNALQKKKKASRLFKADQLYDTDRAFYTGPEYFS